MKLKGMVLAAGLVAAVGFAAPQPAAAQDELVKELASIERDLWKAWKDGDAAPFEKHLAASAIQIGPWGMAGDRAEIISGSSAGVCDVGEYEMDDWKVHRVTGDVVILTYEAEQEGSCDGMTLPEEAYYTTVFVREGGAWKVTSHQETPAARDDD